ncbi:MAG TPA: hypothetical protein VLF68_02990 [Candidatus Saccharimonadales bacterium]|nr:hypothetical protein [Candidatus Saccharimonadales bacterium]
MKRLNLLLTLTSLTVLLVTVERFSPTTKIILQPYSFLRLHEVVQMLVIILLSLLIPFFILKHLSNNFESLKTKRGTMLAALFIIGIYLNATGNGVHEVASFLFNNFCDTKVVAGGFCGSAFFNDYYFGNIVYFIGAILFTVPLILFERSNPEKSFRRNDWIVLEINAIVYALTIFAYAGFDRVLVGLWYSIIATIIILFLLFTSKQKFKYLPFTVYSAIVYILGTAASLLVRFH